MLYASGVILPPADSLPACSFFHCLNTMIIYFVIFPMFFVLSIATEAMNVVDCSRAVPTTCAYLNREVCTYTANTCGPCLQGFFGISGSANAICIPNADQEVLRTLSATRTSLAHTHNRYHNESDKNLMATWQYTDGSPCRININCYSGLCYRGLCQKGVKKCPNYCSNTMQLIRGTCVYRDEFDKVVDTCPPQSYTCRASCECSKGYYGSDCSLTEGEIKRIQDMRGTMCTNLGNTLGMQDIDSTLILQVARQVSGMLIDPDQLNGPGYMACVQCLLDALTNHVSAISSAMETAAVYSSLSLALDAERLGKIRI
jgi:hypothetical protein